MSAPTASEITALTARLHDLSHRLARGEAVPQAELDAYYRDRDELVARIEEVKR